MTCFGRFEPRDSSGQVHRLVVPHAMGTRIVRIIARPSHAGAPPTAEQPGGPVAAEGYHMVCFVAYLMLAMCLMKSAAFSAQTLRVAQISRQSSDTAT